jgi:glycosyltransferase involved in cell wall biosynthesis
MNPPRASVIITNHNYEAFLAETIDSALAQTHPDVEVLVVDDGSTDGSRAVLDRYEGRIRTLLQDGAGQTGAMNAGFAASTGTVVCFLDADDRLDPEALAVAAALMADDPDVVKVHWPLNEIDAHGHATGKVWPDLALEGGRQLDKLLADGPETCGFPPTSGNAFRRSFLAPLFPLRRLDALLGLGSASADAFLSMVAAATGVVAAADRPLGAYRRHGENDYMGRPLAYRLERYARVAGLQWDMLADLLRARGVNADTERWKERSWFFRLRAVLTFAEETVPESATWVLVDDDGSGLRDDPRWRILAFVDRDGTWWGPPADGAAAVSELESMRSAGAEMIVFTWLVAWWRDAYPELFAHLAERYRCVRDDDLLLAFDLREEVLQSSWTRNTSANAVRDARAPR